MITDIDAANEVIPKNLKRKSNEKEEEPSKSAKKIVLKRNSSHTEDTIQPELVEGKILEKAEKKVIKLSEIGAKEVGVLFIYIFVVNMNCYAAIRNEGKKIWFTAVS